MVNPRPRLGRGRIGWTLPVVLAAGVVTSFGGCSVDEEGSAETGGTGGTSIADSGPCLVGQFRCEGDVARACSADGSLGEGIDCTKDGKVCVAGVGCVVCVPGTQACANGVGTFCKSDGSELGFECDPEQGMRCESDGCKGSCAPPELVDSYLGCDYFPTVTLNPVWSGFDFAVAVANAGDAPTNVTVTRGTTNVKTVSVDPGKLEIITLPWVSELKGGDEDACRRPPAPGATRIVKGGAYRLRTDQPVTVYQLGPLAFQRDPVPAECPVGTKCPGGVIAECFSYSNDASLLLPATVLTGNYASIGWPASKDRAGFLAITATRDGTSVEVFGRGEVTAGAGIDAGGNGTVTLDRGDVLEVLSRHDVASGQYGSDISGTRVRASAPVQVITGHSCANVPTATTLACDHLEDSLLPVETLGKDYLVTFPAAVASESPHVVRILAIESGTKLTFDPADVSSTTTLSPADGALEITGVTRDFRVTADKAIAVAQFMQGQDSVPSHSGDPSIAFAVPSEQFRTSYLFIASKTYSSNFVNVVAPTGSSVTLDGDVIAASKFSAIAGSGHSVARVELSQSEVHSIDSPSAFGIVVYGYGLYTSYMYPGGLDLKRITPPPIF